MSSFGVVPASGLSYAPADRRELVLDRTIGDALRVAADAWGDRTALVEGTGPGPRRRWSYISLLRTAVQAAFALLDRLSPGEHVAICAAESRTALSPAPIQTERHLGSARVPRP
jgi:fatty-acyl-CoA synthase